jgi:hypothetical protein
MMPKSKKISPADLFIKDKYVSEELRNFTEQNPDVDGHSITVEQSICGRD